MRNKQTYVMVVIPMAEVKKFILIDVIFSTAAYYAIIIPFHSIIAATAGSMTLPVMIRRTLKHRGRR
ncbi:hypothetical protein SAMN05216378_1677 [Paenibacillus catalpae]|uniref:Uncharacterized protein n=1 Tax=Paenibacillus catalpae TaxID=1045775 RepID=A0A1I1VMI2_9BACL|nr:hypothetical protein [Paenibacillus catalpae]SFD84005.1 hypothetical protein SAMN05216378_1677 [Paenibacillus catalpae]